MRIFNDNNFEKILNIYMKGPFCRIFFKKMCDASRRIWVNRELVWVRIVKKKLYIYIDHWSTLIYL